MSRGFDEPVPPVVSGPTSRSARICLIGLALSLSTLLGCAEYVLRVDPYRQQVLGLVAAQPSEHIVDIGCEDGFWSYELAREVGPEGKVYALDIKEKWVKHVDEQAGKRDLTQVEAILCRTDDTTLEDDSVDVVFFANTIHHIDDLPAYTRHLYDILKPGGRYVVIDNGSGRFGHHSDPEEIGRIGAEAGFAVGDVHRFERTKRYLIVFTKPATVGRRSGGLELSFDGLRAVGPVRLE